MKRTGHYLLVSLAVAPWLPTASLSAQRDSVPTKGLVLRSTNITRPPIAPSAPPPTVTLIGGSPSMTIVNWTGAAPTVAGVQLVQWELDRWHRDNPACCRASTVVPFKGPNYVPPSWNDYYFPLAGVYVYRITSVYSDGSRGTAQVDYTRPDPVNPATLAAVQNGPASVVLTWPEIVNATFYQVWGPGIANTGVAVMNSGPSYGATVVNRTIGGVRNFEMTVVGVPAGTQKWSVGTFYEPPVCAGAPPPTPGHCPVVSTAVSAFTQASLTVVSKLRGLRPSRRPPD